MANEWPTSAEVKAYLGISGTSEDTQIGYFVSAAVELIDQYTGRMFWGSSYGDITLEYEAVPPYVTREDRRVLRLFRELHDDTPTVTNGDGTVLSFSGSDPDGYFFPKPQYSTYSFYYELHLSPRKGNVWTSVKQPIKIVGILNHLGIPGPVFLAHMQLCKFWYDGMHSGSGGANTVASRQTGLVVAPSEIPGDIRLVLDQYRRA